MGIAQTFRAQPAVDTPTLAAAGTYTPFMTQADTAFIQMPAGNITVGGRTITWGSNIKKNLALSAGANAVDVVQLWTPDGVTWYQQASALNLT